jgi:IS5 family transposase
VFKTLAPKEAMYRRKKNQMEFEDFVHPFGGSLDGNNRWVKLAGMIPWEQFEESYSSNFAQSGMGAPAKPVRLALGSLIIRERLGCSDIETLEQIRENPYLQYFLGYSAYSSEAPFDTSMLVHFRKRFDAKSLEKINELIIAANKADKKKPADKHDKEDGDGSAASNSGQLIIDATCAPADITHPTDLKLLGKAREKSEVIIDALHACLEAKEGKPRTYRQKARREYLKAAKTRRLSSRQRSKVIKKQINYVSRNLKSINNLADQVGLGDLPARLYKDLLVIEAIHQQQRQLYFEGKYRVAHRIVSLSQPHIRPIVRSKLRAKTEFGAKISLSLEEGLCHLHRFDFESFNECSDLIAQVESYKERHGVYPESVHADNAYRNSKNRRFCREHAIRLSGAPLRQRSNWQGGAKDKIAHQDLIDRVAIEGKIGQGKRRYTLGLVMTKLASTTRTSVAITIITMNLIKLLGRASLSELLAALRTLVKQSRSLTQATLKTTQLYSQLSYHG